MNPNPPLKLWNRDFALWLLGTTQSALGSAVAGIAMSFLVYGQTGSTAALGTTLALSMLPALLSPLAGTLVDRLPLRVPLVLGNVLRGLLQLGLGLLALSGAVPLPVIYGLALLNGLAGALSGPAGLSVLPHLVPRGEIARASGLMASATQTASLLGLVGGGLLVSQLGPAPSLMLDGVSFLVMAALVALVRLPGRAASRSGASFWADLVGGLRYVRGSAVLLLLPAVALIVNAALAPLEMLLPARMTELGVGAGGLGLFLGLLTGGMALGSLGCAALGGRLRPGPASVGGLLALGGLLLLLAPTEVPWQLYGLALPMGAALGVTNVSLATLFSTLIAAEYRGRVGSLLNMVSMAGMPATLLLLAPVADRLSIATLFTAAGLVTLVGAGVWLLAQNTQDRRFSRVS